MATSTTEQRDVGRPCAEEFQPPLTWWGHTWRTVLVLSISGVVFATIAEQQPSARFVLDVAAGVPAVLLVFWRRRWPVAVAAVTVALSAVSSFAAGPATLASVSLATHRRLAQLIPIGLLNLAAGMTFAEVQPGPGDDSWLVDVFTNVAFIVGLLAVGMYIGSRRELLWTLRARAERAEAEQELRANQSRLEERGRIAREMHDVLAHRISQISMRAGALHYRDDLDADELREGVRMIRDAAHDALNDLRGVLGVLRESDGAPLHTPQPTYADLADLVAEARESGLRVELDDRVEAGEPVPDAAGRTLYRIVQEGITNARKHAPGARLDVELAGSPDDGLSVELRNPLGFRPSSTPGAGLGLVGLAERAALRGGHIEHRHDDGEFVLRGWIPWAA
ncbi:histidine kinase [Nocardioides marinquilinus]|uniref:histidine kinase n=1 Tax=Nocardioides marinquilinus TaxID=1210400 RepID=A0ABP9Q3Y9_9ACTN